MAVTDTSLSALHIAERQVAASDLTSSEPPVDVTGARDTTEEALANLLVALEELGLITDSTTAT